MTAMAAIRCPCRLGFMGVSAAKGLQRQALLVVQFVMQQLQLTLKRYCTLRLLRHKKQQRRYCAVLLDFLFPR
ncbi:hypothetical protein PVAP13_9NG482828 [Panicum virgatum]|uniref:Uncharacterized protein n=1 Tax=Panicum virgatum TaxID=38727 RepID=A0A8T0MXG7_PANVG|nr:hypothetical protein PVAP13_9NG482828 [Panicum virgatum]